MRRGQGTLVVGTFLFVVLAMFIIGVYAKLIASIMSVNDALKNEYTRESLKLRERLEVKVLSHSLQGSSLNVSLEIASNSSISTMIKYVLLACYTSTGSVMTVSEPLEECSVTLSPGEIRVCNITYTFPTECGYVTITLVTALGNSYSVRVG